MRRCSKERSGGVLGCEEQQSSFCEGVLTDLVSANLHLDQYEGQYDVLRQQPASETKNAPGKTVNLHLLHFFFLV